MKLPFEKKKRELFVKKDSDGKIGAVPEKRSMQELLQKGIVNVDKPKGPTSHQVSDFVKKILGLKKSGHSGTLDPAVTGVLPVALGPGTRVVQALLKAGKEYVGIMHLHKDVPDDELKKVFEDFRGKIKQLPPIKSAVKRRLRQREIYYLEILERIDKDVLFVAGVEAGTYIRKLVSDMGSKLGGAHMAELRRTKAGPFDESTTATLQDLSDAFFYWKNDGNEKFLRKCIQPFENAVAHLPKIWVLDSTIKSLCNGVDLKIPGVSKFEEFEKDQEIAVLTLKGELVALGQAMINSHQSLKEKKGVVVKINKVFMKQP